MIRGNLAACAASAVLMFTSLSALADDHAYTEGSVLQISSIRTETGRMDDYMNWLDTTWKKMEELAKKAGYILDYQVYQVDPRGPNDPDLYLVVTYKNYAALDGALAQNDEVSKQVEGSIPASNKSAAERDKMRRILGVMNIRNLKLK